MITTDERVAVASVVGEESMPALVKLWNKTASDAENNTPRNGEIVLVAVYTVFGSLCAYRHNHTAINGNRTLESNPSLPLPHV